MAAKTKSSFALKTSCWMRSCWWVTDSHSLQAFSFSSFWPLERKENSSSKACLPLRSEKLRNEVEKMELRGQLWSCGDAWLDDILTSLKATLGVSYCGEKYASYLYQLSSVPPWELLCKGSCWGCHTQSLPDNSPVINSQSSISYHALLAILAEVGVQSCKNQTP